MKSEGGLSMKRILMVIFLVCCFILTLSSGPVLASSATATAYLDMSTAWTSLTSNPNYGFLNVSGAAYTVTASASNANPLDLPTGVTTPTYAYQAVTNATATGSLETATQGGATGYLYSNATAINPPNNDPAGYGQADVRGYVDYSGSGKYVLNFTIPYYYNYSLIASSGTGSSASGFASYEVAYTITNPLRKGPISQDYTDFISLTVDNGHSDSITTSGNIPISLTLKKGDHVDFLFNVTSYASAVQPVPVPAAIWLLGSGLIGLVGFKRRKRQ
jgi:hypothetical protein